MSSPMRCSQSRGAMYIGFTGHRDKRTAVAELDRIRLQYPNAIWVHGGAIGFDTQVANYAKDHKIEQVVIRPRYTEYPPKLAPLARNKAILALSSLLVACYDGRKRGGTRYTVDLAIRKKIPVIYLECI